MSICRQWSLVKRYERATAARCLKCRSWSCEFCRPIRKAQLLARAFNGSPTRFLTLTVNPAVGENPEQRLKLLSRAWRLVVKRLRRRYPGKSIEYLAIVEATKNGEPHLHLLVESPYVPQAWLSSIMAELINAPIVDIRSIRNKRNVFRYVAKYITKAPHHFGSAKRYWFSRNYEPPMDGAIAEILNHGPRPTVVRLPLAIIAEEWHRLNYTVSTIDGDSIFGVMTDAHTGPPP